MVILCARTQAHETICMIANSRSKGWQLYCKDIAKTVFIELWMPYLCYKSQRSSETQFVQVQKTMLLKCFMSFNFINIGLYEIYLMTKVS